MKIKTILREDEIQLTLTTRELVWLQVLFDSLLHGDAVGGFRIEINTFAKILRDIKKEGCRMRETPLAYENTENRFLSKDFFTNR